MRPASCHGSTLEEIRAAAPIGLHRIGSPGRLFALDDDDVLDSPSAATGRLPRLADGGFFDAGGMKRMARDAQALRRRAALAALREVLDMPALLRELWTLQDTLHGESVGEIIEAVDALGSRHALDATTRKQLYANFFQALHAPESALPPDPWSAMQALRSKPAVPPPRPPAVPPAAAAARPAPNLPGVVRSAVPPSGASERAPVLTTLTSEVPWVGAGPAWMGSAPHGTQAQASIVFGALMRAVIAELRRFHGDELDDVRRHAMRALAGNESPASLREQFGQAWEDAAAHDWTLLGSGHDLASLVDVTRKALRLAIGRSSADRIIQRAAQAAESVPEARRWPPARLINGR